MQRSHVRTTTVSFTFTRPTCRTTLHTGTIPPRRLSSVIKSERESSQLCEVQFILVNWFILTARSSESNHMTDSPVILSVLSKVAPAVLARHFIRKVWLKHNNKISLSYYYELSILIIALIIRQGIEKCFYTPVSANV